MARVNPKVAQRDRVLKANANRCCVCKRYGVGLHLHHIDQDSSHTVDNNLAVLCVEHHDRHHRPAPYHRAVNHLELNPEEIRKCKRSWEAFVSETRKPFPKVIATLSAYGSYEAIHSVQLVMQWSDRIEYKRSYHLPDGNLDKMTDAVMDELKDFGPGVKLALVDKPLPVEHCPSCGTGYSRTLNPPIVIRSTDPEWSTQSVCAIYINPEAPSLALSFGLRDEHLFSGHLHLCQGRFLHYSCNGIDERVAVQPRRSVRAQAPRIVRRILKDWTPAKVLIGTGNADAPELIEQLNLPACWERTP
jgi:hypothetical protein